LSGQAPKSLFEGLIESYAPKGDAFEAELPRGEKLRFRIVSDVVEMNALQAAAVKFAKELTPVPGEDPPPVPESWRPYMEDVDEEILAQVYLVAHLALEPDLQNQGNVLQLARSAGAIFNSIKTQIDQACLGLAGERVLGAIDAEKNS